MTPNRWNDERFIKCPKCQYGLIVYPYTDNKYFICKHCGNKIRNRVFYRIIQKFKFKNKKWY